MAIFCVIGSLFGLIVSMIAGLALRKMTFDIEGIIELLVLALVALALSLVSGSMSIPLVFKFGAEKARVLLVVSIFVPLAVCFGLYQVLVLLGIELTEQLSFILLPLISHKIQFYAWTSLAAFRSLVIIGLPSLSINGHTPPAAPNFVAR